MTLAEFVVALGFTAPSYISELETGKHNPSLEFVIKVSRRFNVSMDQLSKDELEAEIRSENDYGDAAEKEMAQKRTDYFAAGTLVVWDVDVLADEVVRVYRATDPTTPTLYHRGEYAEAEPALPGFSLLVDDLLP